MAFPEGFLQELKLRNNLTELVSSYVALKRRGRNMVGLCPFHGEKTPSFNVYTENDSFYCFGCGVGGDVITFVMKIENLDYVEAVRFLAQRVGMEVPESSYDDSMSKLRTRIYEANREAARFFYSTLVSPNGAHGLDYLHSRQLSDRTIRRFGLGFADADRNSLCNHLKSLGFTDSEIAAANLGIRRKNGNGVFDRFYNRVMFPIIDLRGNVIAFGGRIMTDEKPKYLNTSDTPVFKKSENLFSLNNAKGSGKRELILCEGYMDVIALNQAGFANAVATLGTALTSEQAMLMKRYCDEVIICYDADEAGQKATSRAIGILRNAGISIRVLTVPSGKDPDEFIKANGKDGAAAFQALIDKSGNDIEYKLNKLKAQYDVSVPESRVAFLEESARLVSELESPLERDVYASKICGELNVEKTAFLEQMKRITSRGRRENGKKEIRRIQTELSGRNDKINSEHYKKPRSSSAEEALLVYLIKNPDSAKEISSRLSPDKFQNSLIRRYYEYVLERVNNSLDPLMNITADFSQDEASKLYQLMAQSVSAACTREAMEEYINVINDESRRISAEDAAALSENEIQDYIKMMRETKK